MSTEMDPAHIAWCRAQVEMLRIGGIWGIPRSGLIFTRTGDTELTLTARMPWMEEMPVTAEQLAEQQQEEYEETARHMEAAGVTVIDASVPNVDDDEFKCERCGTIWDIEDSHKRGDEYLCPSCAVTH